MKKNTKKFIQSALFELISNHINVSLIQKSKLNRRYMGYFDEAEKKFCISIRKPQKLWIPVFIHEFCHFRQWKENDPVWRISNDEEEGEFWEWVEGKLPTPPSNLKKVVKNIQKIELNCEKRVAKIIDQYKIEINRDRYIQGANAYIYLYNIVIEREEWYKTPPYQIKKIIDTMPTKFCRTYSTTPKKYLKLVNKLCF